MSDDLVAMAVDVLDTNRYLALATVEPDGSPRVSPVFFTHDGYRDFFWVSSPDARHSRNVVERPAVSAVVFDSSVRVGQGRAVYLTGRAGRVADADLGDVCARAFRRVHPDARAFGPDELSGAAELRLYRLGTVDRHEVHVAGRHPVHGTGIDRRVAVPASRLLVGPPR